MKNLRDTTDVAERQSQLAWLVNLLSDKRIRVKKIINFGCNKGVETHALAIAFQAEEVIGVDNHESSIQSAEGLREQLTLGEPPSTSATIEYVVGDMSTGIGLKDDWNGRFDLAYCANVLDKVADRAGSSPERALLGAIETMVGVVRDGALVVAEENGTYGNAELELDLNPLFESLQLERVACEESNDRIRYVYRKLTVKD